MRRINLAYYVHHKLPSAIITSPKRFKDYPIASIDVEHKLWKTAIPLIEIQNAILRKFWNREWGTTL